MCVYYEYFCKQVFILAIIAARAAYIIIMWYNVRVLPLKTAGLGLGNEATIVLVLRCTREFL